MKVLLVNDDSVMSSTLRAELVDDHLTVDSLAMASVDDETMRSRCLANDAVVFLSSGWDRAAAERESRNLDLVISALGGSGKRLVYVSEATVIGDTGDGFGNEDNPSSSSAAHPWRVQAERSVMRAISTGVHSVIVRPTLVHGRGAGGVISSLAVYAETTGQAVYVGDGAARVSTVHVDDVVSLIRLAVRRAPEGFVCSAASSEVLTWQQVAAAVARGGDRSSEVASVSESQARAAGLDVATMTTNNVVRDGSANRRLGWQPAGAGLVAEALALPN